MEGYNLGKQEKSFPLASANRWFPSWPIFFSLVLHGLMVCFLLTWSCPRPAANLPKIVTIRILETETEKDPLPPAPVESKCKIVPKKNKIKPDPPKVVLPKEAEDPSPLSPPVAESVIHEVSQHLEENRNDDLPQEEEKQKAEPAPLGMAEGKEDAEISSLGKGDAPLILAEKSGPVQKGIPGGQPIVALSGEGRGGKGGGSGIGIGEEGSVPSKGVKAGSVFFHGQGEGGKKTDLSSYLGSARLKIEKAKRYPREARRMGWEGRVILSFQINQNGDVGEIVVVQSSRYPELDEEGITTIRRAAPFLPPPLADQDTLEVRVPLVFKLE